MSCSISTPAPVISCTGTKFDINKWIIELIKKEIHNYTTTKDLLR